MTMTIKNNLSWSLLLLLSLFSRGARGGGCKTRKLYYDDDYDDDIFVISHCYCHGKNWLQIVLLAEEFWKGSSKRVIIP